MFEQRKYLYLLKCDFIVLLDTGNFLLSLTELIKNGLHKCVLTGVLGSCSFSFAWSFIAAFKSEFSPVSLKICFRKIMHNCPH